MNSMPFRQLKSFLKILIGVQYHTNPWQKGRFSASFPRNWETLNKSPSAEQRIFFSIRAVLKAGNTQSIPPLSEPSAKEKSLAVGSCRFLQSFLRKNWKNLFTFADNSCILCREQSRRPCVKCHRDGEFARRTKERFPRWGHRTRCCIWEKSP